jgi:heme-degrading monooxygenase HmoA
MNVSKLFLISNLMLLAVLCSACDDADADDGNAESSSSSSGGGPSAYEQSIIALRDCEPTDLVMLSEWVGPAFDPATGELLAPLPAGHVEAVVNGWAIQTDEAQQLRVEHGTNVIGDLFTRDGFLGFEGMESVECNLSASHSLWRDEAAMLAFVSGDAHLAAMGAGHTMHTMSAGAHWVGEAREQPPTWREGVDGLTRTLLEE